MAASKNPTANEVLTIPLQFICHSRHKIVIAIADRTDSISSDYTKYEAQYTRG